jgi:DNA-binding transcriptional MerR regulator
VARLAGVSPDTIRHYERRGLLRRIGRTESGYRMYNDEDVRRVLLVRHALALGFHLRELQEILQCRDRGRLPCRQVRETATGRLAAIDQQIHQLKKLREQLRAVVADWDQRLSQSGDGKPAHLLESLASRSTK